jgi:tetratricopeptide (TPR) repeat protein
MKMSEDVLSSENNLKKFLTSNKDLTFLVGAGCSIDKPSCLAAGGAMMEALLHFICAESEIQNILKFLPDSMGLLRFEELVEIVRDYLDPKLRLIDYYGLCDKPNIQHFYLAKMLDQGHFVITTNFDFLIERALLQSNISSEKICPIITKADFTHFPYPHDAIEKGKIAVYKVHGSTKNIITGEDTRDSLITTIQALNRVPKARTHTPNIIETQYFGLRPYQEDRAAIEFENLFRLEAYKRPLFRNITKGRSLVVMGYSGSDDFDIVPTLQLLEGLNTIIWLQYKYNDGGRAQIHEIGGKFSASTKTDRILTDLKKANVAEKLYRVDVNTSRFISTMLAQSPNLSNENFSVTPAEWIKQELEEPNELTRLNLTANIYEELKRYDDALRCAREMYRRVYPEKPESRGAKRTRAYILRRVGEIYYRLGKYQNALDMFKFAIDTIRTPYWLENKGDEVPIYNWLGKTYLKLGELKKAKENLTEASSHNFAGEEGRMGFTNPSRLCVTREHLGILYYKQKKYKKAIAQLEEALDLYEDLGDPAGKFSVFYHLGLIYHAQKNYSEALKWFQTAHQVAMLLELQDSPEFQEIQKYINLIEEKS